MLCSRVLTACWSPDAIPAIVIIWRAISTRRRFGLMKELLEYVGVDPKRFNMSWVSASEGSKWKDVVEDVVGKAKEAGPFEQFRRNKINW